jgi:hypothetical protein
MADITHSTRTSVRPYRSRGGTFDERHFQPSTIAASSALIRYGDIVQFDVNVATANHRIVKSSTMANAPAVLSSAFIGIAMEADESSVSSAAPNPGNLLVCVAGANTEFLFPTKSVTASSHVGRRTQTAYDSTNKFFYLNLASTHTDSSNTVVVTEVPNAGDTNGFVVAKFLSTSLARIVSGAF